MHSNSSFELPSSSTGSSSRKKWYQRWWGRLILVLLFIIVTVTASLGFYVFNIAMKLRSGELTPAELLGDAAVSRNNSMLFSDADPRTGPKDAKVVIVEFSDFQCPYCGNAFPVIKELMKNYGDRVTLVYRDFPLSDIHAEAVTAAMAAQCAAEQGKFWEMHDKLFENQDDLSVSAIKVNAIQVGLNTFQFDSCMQSGKYLEEIQRDYNDGLMLGVEATPTFFINGKMLEGALPIDIFEKIIVSELTR